MTILFDTVQADGHCLVQVAQTLLYVKGKLNCRKGPVEALFE